MKGEQFAISFMGNTVKLNVFHKVNEPVEDGIPVISYGRLRTVLESGNETYLTLLDRISELELELQKYKRN